MTKILTNSDKEQVLQALSRLISGDSGKDGKPSQNVVARQLGVSAPTLSQIRTGKGGVFSEAMWLSLYNHPMLGLRESDLCATRNLVAIDTFLRDCQMTRRMVALAAYTGAGKTTALRYYTGKEQGACYVLCTTVMTRRDLLEEIALVLNADSSGRPRDILASIVDKVRRKNNPLLILDDVGKLSEPCMRLIQIIYDQTEGVLGIALAGIDLFKTLIERKAKQDKLGYRELKSRISMWQKLEAPGAIDIEKVCLKNNISEPSTIATIAHGVFDYRELKNRIENYLRSDLQAQIASKNSGIETAMPQQAGAATSTATQQALVSQF